MGNLMNTVHRSVTDEHAVYLEGPFDLPGPIENGVTHRAWHQRISFQHRLYVPTRHDIEHRIDRPDRCRSAFVTQRNGAGTRHYALKGNSLSAIRHFIEPDPNLAFFLILDLLRAHEESVLEGRADGVHYVARAAAQGRLRVRKVRGQNAAKVSVMHPHIERYAEWDATYGTVSPPPDPADISVGRILINQTEGTLA